MTSQRAQRLRSRAGYSLIELLTAVSIFGVLAVAGLPHVDTHRVDLQTATEQVITDYRWTRTRAITSGVHYALTWTSDTNYQVQKLKQVGTNWTLDQVVKTVTLPSSVSHWGWPDMIEFNTRGMMISTTSATWHGVYDYQHSSWRLIAIWPSGQTNEYD